MPNNETKVTTLTLTGRTLPAEGYIRLPQVLAVIPISKSSWYAGIKSGRYPKPVKLSSRTTCWRVDDIRALIASGQS